MLSDRISTAGAILAGGAARRFGGHDKCRLVVEGRSIIIRQMEILQQVAGEIFVVSPFAGRFADLPVGRFGPVARLLANLKTPDDLARLR